MNAAFLRHFTEADLPVLRTYYVPERTDEEIMELLTQWNAGMFQGKHFEMFALCDGDTVVGMVSLYQHNGYIVSAGPEVFEPFRRRGYGEAGLRLAYEHAGRQGYTIASAQIRTDNDASIRLHEKLGFLRDCEMTNRRGNRVYTYLKQL